MYMWIYNHVSLWDFNEDDIEKKEFERLPGIVFDKTAISFETFVQR